MSYASLLRPRSEILSIEGPEPIIDLANVEDGSGKKLEARPIDFFELTYPTADMRRVISNLADRFADQPKAPGLFLFEGLKGSGKSHLLVTIYHLFSSPAIAQQWLTRHNIPCQLPSDVLIVHNKFTDLPLESIWDFIFLKLTGQKAEKRIVQPSLDDVKKILGDRKLVLIFDELEQGIRAISDQAIRSQNIGFLQMLSEWGNRSNQVTIFASIYSDVEEPGATLKRVSPLRIQFAQSNERDRAKVVLHRVFENYLSFDSRSASTVIEGYVNYWARFHTFGADEYRQRFYETYPFTPDLLDILLKRVPARGGFQNVRGALGFLANLVRLTHQSADVISPASASLLDREVLIRLSDLDTTGGDLVTRAKDNFQDLKSSPLSNELAAATLLYTLAGTGRMVGATREELLRSVLCPGVDINLFEGILLIFQKYAANFHVSDALYFFDLEENADAKVEFHSLRKEYEEKAPAELRKVWLQDVFREQTAVVFSDETLTREAVEQLDKGRIRWVLSPHRLSAQERHNFYFGLTSRNEVIVLEPKDDTFNLDRNADLLKWIRRSMAAADLALRARDTKRKDDYLRISKEDRTNVTQAIQRAGLVYLKWESYESQFSADVAEFETLGSSKTKEDVLTYISQNYYPVPFFVDHLSDRLAEIRGRSVKEVEQEYRNTLGFPVPTHQDRVTKALRQLCKERKISINHQRGNYCGQDPSLTDNELMNATIDAPFTDPPTPPKRSTPGPIDIFIGPDDDTGSDNDGGRDIVIIPPVPDEVSALVHEINTLPNPTPGGLRQDIAARLQDFQSPVIRQVDFMVVLEQSLGDLSALPSSFRGSLSGQADVFAEITIRQKGAFTKANIEQMAERLPSIQNATYQAKLKVEPGDNNAS